jgi:hypothetical protein
LQNKWLRGKGHNKIVLYPDVGSYLKNSLTPKEREKILKEPLNNYFMFTDVMVGMFCYYCRMRDWPKWYFKFAL